MGPLGKIYRVRQQGEQMMRGSLKLGTLAGIDIRVHYTWFFAFVLIAWSLALGYFPTVNAGLGAGTYWVLGVVSALLLFGSVLVHELGHSLVAGARGIRVDSIVLFIFGGVSNITKEASTARDEFLIAVVGPLTSLVLAGLFWVLGQVFPADTALSAVATYLAFTNLLLGAFNIVPGFPLDGGRVLRSILWGTTGDMARATRTASYVGQGVAFLMIAWGVSRLLAGDVFGGLWTAFIGWFLNSGAEASRQQLTVGDVLRGVPVSTVMDTSPTVAEPTLSVQDFVFQHTLRHGHRALPVVEGGRLVGIVSITDAKHLSHDAWTTTPVGEVMTRTPLKTLAPEADLNAALELMVANGVHQLPIVRDGALVGMLSRSDVMRYMQLGAELNLRGSGTSGAEPAQAKA
jgi:Zn-dependent protease/predicted transcriptional regulator